MTRLAFFLASFVTGVVLASVAMLGLVQVAPEAAAPPARTMDSCACGGAEIQLVGCQAFNRGSYWDGYFLYRRASDGFIFVSWWTSNTNLC